jgi:hypothetical protein
MVSKRVEDLKVDELKKHLRTLKAQGRKNAVQTGKKADLQSRLAKIARDIGLDPSGTNWNAALAARGGDAPKAGGVKTRAGAALELAKKQRNEALAERNIAKMELENAKKALIAKTEECEGIARNRNIWASKVQKKSSKKPVAFEVPATHRKVPERVERRLAPKKHAFYDDEAARARARHEAAEAKRAEELFYKTEFARGRLAYGDYVRAKKRALDDHVPRNSSRNMFDTVDKRKENDIRDKAKRLERLKRIEKRPGVRPDVRKKMAEMKRREIAARASKDALERALRKARKMHDMGVKRAAEFSASGAAQRAAKRRV